MSAALDSELHANHFRVVIFGSARIREGSQHHEMIRELARRIAREGADLVTGGGPGLMDAASTGHHEGRGSNEVHTIGLQIRLPHEQPDSKHLDIKREFKHFPSRLNTFMLLSDCVVVAPGGIGTMLELFYTWQLLQVEQRSRIPIILVGEMWPDLLAWMRRWMLREKLVSPEDFDMVHLARTVDEAMVFIRKAHEEHGYEARASLATHSTNNI